VRASILVREAVVLASVPSSSVWQTEQSVRNWRRGGLVWAKRRTYLLPVKPAPLLEVVALLTLHFLKLEWEMEREHASSTRG